MVGSSQGVMQGNLIEGNTLEGSAIEDGIQFMANTDLPEDELKGIRICSQANGFWKEEFEKREDPTGRDYYWLTGFFHNREPDGGGKESDEWALKNHYASVVPVNTDLTARDAMEGLRDLESE